MIGMCCSVQANILHAYAVRRCKRYMSLMCLYCDIIDVHCTKMIGMDQHKSFKPSSTGGSVGCKISSLWAIDISLGLNYESCANMTQLPFFGTGTTLYHIFHMLPMVYVLQQLLLWSYMQMSPVLHYMTLHNKGYLDLLTSSFLLLIA